MRQLKYPSSYLEDFQTIILYLQLYKFYVSASQHWPRRQNRISIKKNRVRINLEFEYLEFKRNFDI